MKQFRRLISLIIVAATLFSLVSASMITTSAITADEMKYVRFSAMRHRNVTVKYRFNGEEKTVEFEHGDLGFLARAVSSSGNTLPVFGAYSFGICTEGDKIGSGGPENANMRDGEVTPGASESYLYTRANEIFDFHYYDENKTIPTEWVFKCFYYANQIAIEKGYDINELEKGYWETEEELKDLKQYNENKISNTLTDKDALIDYAYCVQIAAKMIPAFMFETDKNGLPVKFNAVQIINATSIRGHRFNANYREDPAYIVDVMQNCAEIIKRSIEDPDGITDKIFRIDEKGAWAVTNPDGKTVSHLTFYQTFNPAYRDDYQRMAVFTTEYQPPIQERGQIEIYKTDTNGNPLQGAEFTITNISNPLVKTTLTTNKNGYAATGVEELDFGIYTVVETKFPQGYTKADGAPTSWRVTLSSDTPNAKITIRAVNDTAYTAVSGVKTWVDANDQDGIRPNSITVRLYADGTEVQSKKVTSADGWKYTFSNLPVMKNGTKIVYTVKEDTVKGYTTAYNSFDITNTHTPEVITVSGVKTWVDSNDQDGIRPNSITVRLYADGTEVQSKKVTSANGWKYTFSNLPVMKNGTKIVYTVKEDTVKGYTTAYNGFDITNTHTPDVTSVTGVKTWVDANNQDGIRPNSITVRLYADGTEVQSKKVTSADGWKYTFSNLPVMKNGTKIVYTVKEDTVKGYTTTYNGFDITNTHTPDVTSVTGVKTWVDSDNQDGIRPNSITVRLYADGTEVQSKKVTSADGWKYTFSDLPVMKNGTKIVYTVKEDTVKGYTTTYNGFDITNTHTPDVTSVTGVKTWVDSNDQDGIRPDSITVRLYADGVEVAHVVVTADDEWAYSFENLPKYKYGNAIVYTISEDEVTGYTTTYDGNNIINTHVAELISIEGVKIWNDADNQDGIRPDSITVRLYADGVEVAHVVVRSSDDWSYSFENLPKYNGGKLITYTVSEDNVDGYKTSVNGFDITNTHTPEVITVSGVKTWDDDNDRDGVRPDSITVRLYADGVEVAHVVVRSSDDWSYSFENLPKYNGGKLITYTVSEDNVDGYKTSVNGFDITNTHTPEVITVSGVKTWDDDNDRDGVRPDSITVRLYADGVEVAHVVVTADDEWAYSFENLPKYKDGNAIVYTISEDEVEGYTTDINGFDITNTHVAELISIEGVKIWNDADNQDGIRPDSITVRLYADGVEVAHVVATADDEWAYSFENLPKYKDGNAIVYTISEDEVEGYTTDINGFDITNTHVAELISIEGVKIWNDADNQDGIRPDSITVRLYADGVEVAHVVVTADDEWAYSFENLPKYKYGNAIVYTISEDEVTGYTTTYDGNNIINTHVAELISIEGVKIWNDADNQDGIRPDSITVRLYADGVEVAHVAVTADDEWKFAFKDLPKNKNGNEITYTITEDSVGGYTTEIKNFTVTNHYAPEIIAVAGTKTWNDADNQDGIRPDSITVRLYADGVEVAHVVVTADDEWKFTFEDLPKFSNGVKIVYTISEDEVEGYTSSINGFDIVNTHTPDVTSVTGVKTWLDSDNIEGKRPDSITVRLYADGVEVAHVVVTADDEWKFTFEDLPKFNNGVEIVYTISENEVEGYETEINGFNITNSLIPTILPPPTGENVALTALCAFAAICLAVTVFIKKIKV